VILLLGQAHATGHQYKGRVVSFCLSKLYFFVLFPCSTDFYWLTDVKLGQCKQKEKKRPKKRTSCKCTLVEVVLLLSGLCHCSLPLHSSTPFTEFSIVGVYILFLWKNYICSFFYIYFYSSKNLSANKKFMYISLSANKKFMYISNKKNWEPYVLINK